MPATVSTDPSSTDHEQCRALFQSPLVRIGAAHCAPDHASFREPGPVSRACFLVPLHPVRIAPRVGRPFVADSTLTTIYNAGDEVEREALCAEGDVYHCFQVAPAVLLDTLEIVDPGVRERERRPFRWNRAPLDPSTRVLEATLHEYVRRRRGAETLFVEESVVRLLRRVAFAADRAERGARTRRHSARLRRQEIVERARALLAERLDAQLGLEEVARAAECSLSHLCRVFLESTGITLATYRNRLRLGLALDRVLDGETDLGVLARKLGFSSHSHMTFEFRRQFGLPPSRLRARLKPRELRRFPAWWQSFDRESAEVRSVLGRTLRRLDESLSDAVLPRSVPPHSARQDPEASSRPRPPAG